MFLTLFLPEIILSVTALFILIADLFIREDSRRILGIFAVIGSIISINQLILSINIKKTIFHGMFIINPFSNIIKIILLVSTSFVILISVDYSKRYITRRGEYYCLILLSVVGMMFMVSAIDFLSFFICLQLTSIPLYILSGIDKNDARSNEAAFKYLMLGMLASVVMLYGITFLYGLTAATNFETIALELSETGIRGQYTLIMAMFFIFTGFAFKIAAVPFHFWVPDTYEGSPTPVTTLLATAPKVAGFAALLNLINFAFLPLIGEWRILFYILSVLSMFVGNIVALSQTNIKRMLGFSSIAHVGYILMAFAVADRMAYTAAIFYLMIYAIVNIGAFAVVAAVLKRDYQIRNLTGLSKTSPLMSFSIAFFLISMIGIPPTPGFWGKLDLFASAIERGMTWLAVIGIINSVISVYYYVNVLRFIFIKREKELAGYDTSAADGIEIPMLMKFVVGTVLCITIVISLYPQPFIEVAKFAVMALKV